MSLLDQRVELRALLAGVAADWLGTTLTLPLLGLSFGITGENAEARLEELLAAPGFLLTLTAHGTLFTAFGGWVAGRLAPGAELRHAVLVGVLSLALAAALSTAPGEGPQTAWWAGAVGYLLAVPAAAAGGWLARSVNRPAA